MVPKRTSPPPPHPLARMPPQVRELVLRGCNPNTGSGNGETALHCMASFGRVDCAKALKALCGKDLVMQPRDKVGGRREWKVEDVLRLRKRRRFTCVAVAWLAAAAAATAAASTLMVVVDAERSDWSAPYTPKKASPTTAVPRRKYTIARCVSCRALR